MDAAIQRPGELSLPEAFLLLATNDATGEPELPPAALQAGVAGAVLAELDLRGAIELQGRRVRATGSVPDSNVRRELQLIREKSRRHTPRRWVAMLESRAEVRRVYEGMAARGIVEPVGEKHLGLFKTMRYPERDHGPEAGVLEAVRRQLGAADSPGADPRTSALVSLLYAAGLLGRVLPEADQGRVRELAAGHWPSRAVEDELRMVRLAEAEAAT